MALILDPSDDLAETLSNAEEVFLYASFDTEAQGAALNAAVEATRACVNMLRDAAAATPALFDPTGTRELGPMYLCPEIGAYRAALYAGLHAIDAVELEEVPPAVVGALGMIDRCCELVNDPVTREAYSLLVHGWPEPAGDPRVLTQAEYDAYRQLVAAAPPDPLDRFAMDGNL